MRIRFAPLMVTPADAPEGWALLCGENVSKFTRTVKMKRNYVWKKKTDEH